MNGAASNRLETLDDTHELARKRLWTYNHAGQIWCSTVSS